MDKALFSITCTTCRARLKVRSADVIGAILDCPKCGSFVQITPPDGWKPPPAPAPTGAKDHLPTAQKLLDAPTASSDKVGSDSTIGRRSDSSIGHRSDSGIGRRSDSTVGRRSVPPAAPPVATVQVIAAPGTPPPVTAPPAAAPPPATAPAAPRATPAAATAEVASPPIAAPPVVRSQRWRWMLSLPWGKWFLIGSAPLVGLAVVVGTWSFIVRHLHPVPQPVVTDGSGETATPAPPQTPAVVVEPGPMRPRLAPLDRRWLPERTVLLFSFRPSRLAGQPHADKLLAEIDPLWRVSTGAVLNNLGLKLDAVQRLTWAATDLGAWPEQSVVIIELAPEHDTTALAAKGEAADVGLGKLPCRRLPGTAWTHPLVIVDAKTVVTGQEALLRALGQRTEAHLQSAPLDRLLGAVAPDADGMLLVDLAAARTAHWKPPATLLDVWPAGAKAWHELCDIPIGAACTVRWREPVRGELALACDSATAAERLRTNLDVLVPAIKQWLPKQADALQAALQAGRLTLATAEPYHELLDDGQAALQTANWKVADGTLWLRLNWGRSPLGIAAAASDSLPAMRADWLSAARSLDEANFRRLLSGMAAFQKDKGRLPSGAMGDGMLPPETRLSWIAALLPYCDRADWHHQLELGNSWDSQENQGVAKRSLPEVINPVLGPAKTEAGFPVTHYVGVAGLGDDAARLPVDHLRAGVFAYGRVTRLEDIGDGAANTIAILGVVDHCGPWASGGTGTVRALTKPPYVNGPDGFGSGQPEGMLAGMADGAVRFISKDVNPRVIEELATINGHEDVTAAVLDQKSPVPPSDTNKPETPGPAKPEATDAAKPDPPPAAKPDAPAHPAEKPAATAGPEKPLPAAVPPPIDVEARLAEGVAQIDLVDMPLGEALETLSAQSGMPITLDPDALLAAGASPRDAVSVHLTDSTIGKVLAAILAGRKLSYVARNGHVVITSPAADRETLTKARYDISDLAGADGQGVAELGTLVEKFVAPESWRSAGGRGSVRAEGGVLTIEQTGVVHRQIIIFCEKLRTARGKTPRSRLDPALFVLATRLERARPALAREITITFRQPTPLSKILPYLKKQADVDILVDYPALRAAGLAADPKETLRAQKQPLAAALRELLGPLGLAGRAVDARLIQITTMKTLADRLEVEFYPVGSLLAKGQQGSALIDRIKTGVAPQTWSGAGGQGQIHLDRAANCLIVLQAQPVQAAVQTLLSEGHP